MANRAGAKTPRVFIEAPLTGDFPQCYVLDNLAEVHRLQHVLRLEAGAALILLSGGVAYRALWVSATPKSITCQVLGVFTPSQASGPELWVLAALIKEQRWDWLLEKATELGARRIIPLQTRHSVVQVTNPLKKQQRWQAIIERAARQCEVFSMPQIQLPMAVETTALLEALPAASTRLLLQEWAQEGSDTRQALKTINGASSEPIKGPIVIACGPEGGWHAEESHWWQHVAGFAPVSLGPRILRAETAVLAALAHWL